MAVTLILSYVVVNVVPLTSEYVLASFCGGITCVIVPALSCVNGADLNHFALNAHEPKLLLELVIDWSPPDSATK